MADSSESGAHPAPTRARRPLHAALRYALAAASVVAATLLMFGLYDLLDLPRGSVPFIFYFGAVILSARYGGRGPGLAAVILSAVAADYLFLPPFDAFAFDRSAVLQLSIFVLVSLFISQLTDHALRAERRAHEAGESLATTLRSIGDGVIAADASGRVALMNPVAERLTGWREAEALGRDLSEVFRIANEHTGATVESPVARVLREGVVVGLANHTVLLARDGARTPIDDSGAPVRDHDGRLVGAVMVFHDISERRRAEAEGARLAAIIESSDDAIIGKDLAGLITSWNKGAERVYGYAAEEAVGRHISVVVPEEGMGELEEILRRIAAGSRVEQLETERVRKDGRRIQVSLTISPIIDSADRVVGASTIARDITERKRAEQLLRESQRQLQLVTDNAPLYISYCDADGRFRFVNRPYAERFGVAPDKIVGRTIADVLGDDAYEAIRPQVEEALAGRRVELEAELPYRDLGRRFMRVQYVPHEDGGRVLGFVAVVEDITEQKRAELERAGLARQVEAERRRLKDLVGNVPGVVWEAWGSPDESEQRIDFVSDYVEQMLGYTVEEWLRTPNFWLQIVHPDDRERAAREAHDIFEGRRGGTSEFRWLHRDGRAIHVESQSVVILDGRGEPAGMRGVTLDISARKRAEELLRESESRLQLAQRAARIGTWEWNVKTGRAVWSEGIWNLLGVEPQAAEPSFDTFFGFIHPEDREGARRGAEAAFAGGEGEYAGEFRVVRPDGETLWLASKGRIIRDADGAAERMIGVNIDVTDRKRAEEERERLLELEQAARTAAESAAARTARLQAVTAALSEALTPAEVASVIVEHGLSSLGAAGGVVVVRNEEVAGGLELIGSAGLPAEAVEKWRRFPLETRVPTAEAVRTGRHVLVESIDEWLRRNPATGLLGELGPAGVGALAAVPLLVDGRAIGAVGLSFLGPRRFEVEDTAFLHALARQCAQALDRARLYEAERRSHVEIESSERRYRALADSMPQIVWTARADGFTDYYNRRWYEYTGTKPGQTEGWGWQHVVHPEDLEGALRRWSRAVASGEEFEIEYRFRHASDGEYRWHLGRAEPLRDPSGRVVKWFGTATDIHDQKQAADRLRTLAEASALLASSLDYEATLEGLARLTVSVLADYCLIDLIGRDGGVTRVAVSHADPAREPLARRLRDFPPDMTKEAGVALVLRTGEAYVVADVDEQSLRSITRGEEHYRVLRELGLRSFMTVPLNARERTIGALTLGSSGPSRHYGLDDLAFVEEIARRAALAIDNARLYREARDANRAKDEFLATLSHELRTPLTPIIGWTHMLKAGRLPEPDSAHGLDIIEKNAQSLTRLINDLLDMSSILSGKMGIERAPVDLGQALAEAVETVRPQAERKGVRLEYEPGDGAARWVVSGDRTRLVQVFWNLLNNAVKFSGEGGRVRVSCAGAGGRARVEVSDEGAGIPSDFLPHVFERFRQADGSTTREHGGLGIGLALVKSFTEAHGGIVTAESRGPGSGSSFVVQLPLLGGPEADAPAEGGAAESGASADGGETAAAPSKGRVLVVEDARDTLDMLRVAFAAHGYEPHVCASAAEALRVASDVCFDIIVSDIGLPQLDGYDLIGLLRAVEHLRGVPAVALTGYASAKDADDALAAGFDLHIPKPVDPVTLIAAVERLLAERGAGGADGR